MLPAATEDSTSSQPSSDYHCRIAADGNCHCAEFADIVRTSILAPLFADMWIDFGQANTELTYYVKIVKLDGSGFRISAVMTQVSLFSV